MATIEKTVKVTVCDMHPESREVEASTHKVLSYDGTTYEMDLCDRDLETFHKAFVERFLSHAQITNGAAPSNGHAPSASAPARTPRRRAKTKPRISFNDVRAWAKANNIPVSTQGRIKVDVIDQYLAAQKQ